MGFSLKDFRGVAQQLFLRDVTFRCELGRLFSTACRICCFFALYYLQFVGDTRFEFDHPKPAQDFAHAKTRKVSGRRALRGWLRGRLAEAPKT